MGLRDRQFLVSFSFAGEQRELIRSIAEGLAEKHGRQRVFFDEWHTAEVAGRDGDLALQRIYRRRSAMVVCGLSEHYNSKNYPNKEWRAIRDLIASLDPETDDWGRLRYLPLRVGDGEVGDAFTSTDILIDVRQRPADEVVELIEQRLSLLLDGEEASTVSEVLDPAEQAEAELAAMDDDRGRFDEFIVDGALSFSLSNIKLMRELRANLATGERVDLKYAYLGPICALNWVDLSEHPGYGLQDNTRALESHFTQVVEAMDADCDPYEVLDVISLGVGDGRLDTRVLFHLERLEKPLGYYYCIDISVELMEHALARILLSPALERDFRVKAIHGDFTSLERLKSIYDYDASANLFLLTGYTLGNYTESDLMRSFYRGLSPDDYLLVDARLYDPATWDGESALSDDTRQLFSRFYRHEFNDRFAFGPLTAATTVSFSNLEFDYDVTQRLTSVPKAVNIVTYCKQVEGKILGTDQEIQHERLDLAVATLYEFRALKRWFETKDWRVVWSTQDGGTGLFLLRRAT